MPSSRWQSGCRSPTPTRESRCPVSARKRCAPTWPPTAGSACRSNLTYGVTGSDGRRFVLRRPPISHVLATAHDMGREHRIISALRDTDVPVPGAVGFCEDVAVNGAPFYVMDFVEGHVVRD